MRVYILAASRQQATVAREALENELEILFIARPRITTVLTGESEKLRGIGFAEGDFVIQCAGWDEDFRLVDALSCAIRLGESNPWIRWAR